MNDYKEGLLRAIEIVDINVELEEDKWEHEPDILRFVIQAHKDLKLLINNEILQLGHK